MKNIFDMQNVLGFFLIVRWDSQEKVWHQEYKLWKGQYFNIYDKIMRTGNT